MDVYRWLLVALVQFCCVCCHCMLCRFLDQELIHITLSLITSHLVLLVGVTPFLRSLRLRHLKSHWDEICQDCYSSKCASIDGVRFSIWCHVFKMATMTSFHREKCCHLISTYAAYAWDPLHPPTAAVSAGCPLACCLQILIHSTFVFVKILLALGLTYFWHNVIDLSSILAGTNNYCLIFPVMKIPVILLTLCLRVHIVLVE